MRNEPIFGVRLSIWLTLIVVILFYFYVEFWGGEDSFMSFLRQVQYYTQKHLTIFQ
ncbi:hypothetical protein L3Q72_04070 [Vibrio sp. JC009]|uniref:hypothetical protein n=1 Tax=Vibrio sp. JC009 TaxID=2912314 RepID=UPI0023AF5630|nr:hypothetical protein [Vibrio sp. JC009]WED22580.1 hypothetical protein L3Q72_04070 [Vibrio sp. JC009]